MSKGKTDNNNNNSGSMSMLLVLFPQDKSSNNSPSPPSKSLFSKAQSTISICALLLFITLLLFTLSTLPNTPSSTSYTPLHKKSTSHPNHHHFALQRMGTLYRRGTRPMTDLLICHVPDDTPQTDFRLFLRLLHRSSLTSSSDVVFIFPSPSSSSTFSKIIFQENEAFSSLITNHSNFNSNFNTSRFFKGGEKTTEMREPLWGNKLQSDDNVNNLTTRPSYGSILSFDATELDSENSFAGFLDRVPFSLRRWACYPMLLGRVRHHFKHVMLVDAKHVLILSDSLTRVRGRSADSVFVFAKLAKKTKYLPRATVETNPQATVFPGVVMGGARGVRRFSNAVVVEIVRAAIQHRKKKRNLVSDSVILSQLAGNEFMLSNKNIRLTVSRELIPEASSLIGHNSGSLFSDYAMIQRGMNNHDLNYVIKKLICSSVVDSSVYRDC